MINVRLAELNICIDNKYKYIQEMCMDYAISCSEPDFTVSVTEEEIRAEDDGTGFEPGYLESLAVYRKIADKITEYDGILIHGVVIEADGEGVIFLARSGVGKTTHIKLWEKLLGDRMIIVNGDKPIVRIIDGEIYAYGTPWAGKEHLHTNMKTKIGKACFLERSEENSCLPVDKKDVFERLMLQVYRPRNMNQLVKILDLLGNFIEQTDFFEVKCNMDISAAETAHKGMMGWKESKES